MTRTLPFKWFDLVSFDKEWLKNKTMTFYEDIEPDGKVVVKPRVFDKDGLQVYPTL